MKLWDRFLEKFAKGKFLLDVSGSFLAIFNLMLLVYGFSDKLLKIVPVPNTQILLIVVFAGIFVAMFIIGWILQGTYWKTMKRLDSSRDPLHQEMIERLKKIEERLDKNESVSTLDKDK